MCLLLFCSLPPTASRLCLPLGAVCFQCFLSSSTCTLTLCLPQIVAPQVKYQVRLEEQQKELEASSRKNELVTMFRAMDKDNNGAISVAELEQVSYFLATNAKFEALLKACTDHELPQDRFVEFWLDQAKTVGTDDGKFGNWESVRAQVREHSGSVPRWLL